MCVCMHACVYTVREVIVASRTCMYELAGFFHNVILRNASLCLLG